METTISLKPDYKLLNPDFNGYKLSSDADVTAYTHSLESQGQEGLEKRQTSSNCYLLTRLEALHNHFFSDPYNSSYVYYFRSKGHLVKHGYSKDSRLSAGEVVWQEDLCREVDETSEENVHYFASIYFPSSDLAVVANGMGSLHVLETGDRTTTQSWLESYECSTGPGILVHARLIEGEAHQRHLHCLFVSVMPPQSVLNNDKYVIMDEKLKATTASAIHLINWVILTYNGATWEVDWVRSLAGEGTIEYISLDEKSSGIILLCHKHFSFVYDSKESLGPEPVPIEEEEEEKIEPKFKFQQTPEDISVWINIGTTEKKNLRVNVTVQELDIHIQETQILHGRFLNPIHADSVTWTIDDGKLEIVIPKATEGVNWKEVFQTGDPVGEELLDPQLVKEVNARLAHLTSATLDANPDPDKPAYNPGQFEDCDEANEDLILLRLDGTTHKLSSIGLLGPTQHLFNCQVQGSIVPAFCIRQDVDGILWQPEEEEKFTHSATYNAFGFVKASKTMAKFTCSAADNSYVAVADVNSHIYVFFQPEAFGGELRNRKSGKRMNTVARQVVISMKTHDEILGLHASPNVLFVLTEKSIFAYCLRSP